jgi:hypothetical protein
VVAAMSKHDAPVTCNSVGSISFVFGLIGGTATTLVIKLLYQQTSEDSTGGMSHFEKVRMFSVLFCK